MFRISAVRTLTAPILASLVAVGCGSNGKIPTYPVKGQITVNGEPAAHARVVLVPSDPNAPKPIGFAKDDGSFEVSTFGTNDGAPKGDYKVLVEWREPKDGNPRDRGADKLGGKYMIADKTPLKATVIDGTNDLPLAVNAVLAKPKPAPAPKAKAGKAANSRTS